MRHLIKFSMFFLAIVSTYFVGKFTAQVAPGLVAVGAAVSLVATYVGLAFADIPQAQRGKALWVARCAMAIEAIYGTLYVLSEQTPGIFAAPLDLWVSVPLAILHGSVFSVLLYYVSLFIVHEQGAQPAEPMLTVEQQLMRETVTTLREIVQTQRLLPLQAPAMEIADTKAETIRKLASLQLEQGVQASDVSTEIIRAATGFDRTYVQQVVSRWRAEQRGV